MSARDELLVHIVNVCSICNNSVRYNGRTVWFLVARAISPHALIHNFSDNIFKGVEDNVVPKPLHRVVSNRSCLKNKSISIILIIC